jgi:hypothetical protein
MDSAAVLSLFDQAFKAIRSTNLSALDHLMLITCVIEQFPSTDAAQFFLDCVSQNSPDESLRSVKRGLAVLADKRTPKRNIPFLQLRPFLTARTVLRDDPPIEPEIEAALRERQGNRCCVSGRQTDDLKPTYIVSPSIKDDADLRLGVCVP